MSPNVQRGHKGFVSQPIEARFWPRVFVPRIGLLEGRLHLRVAIAQEKDTCWEWRGTRRKGHGRDYGEVWYQGRHEPAHKIAWMLYHEKPWPDGKDACHSCDYPPCVNPLHVWPGTIQENALDAARKGRLSRPCLKGEAKRLAQLTVCKRGHSDWRRNKRGNRFCGTCQRMSEAKYRKRAAAVLTDTEPTP